MHAYIYTALLVFGIVCSARADTLTCGFVLFLFCVPPVERVQEITKRGTDPNQNAHHALYDIKLSATATDKTPMSKAACSIMY